MAFTVYILLCSDGSYYTGHTENLEYRLAQHDAGKIAAYTATRRPLELLFSQDFSSREEALDVELQIKRWSRRKKEALIAGDWSRLSQLSKRRTP